MAPPSRSLLDGDLRIEVREGYVHVWHCRAAVDLAELETVLTGIDEALETHRLDRIMFDSREANYTEGEVQARMWVWLKDHPALKRAATLVESPRLAVSVGLTGMSQGIRIKAFHLESEAEAWLRAGGDSEPGR